MSFVNIRDKQPGEEALRSLTPAEWLKKNPFAGDDVIERKIIEIPARPHPIIQDTLTNTPGIAESGRVIIIEVPAASAGSAAAGAMWAAYSAVLHTFRVYCGTPIFMDARLLVERLLKKQVVACGDLDVPIAQLVMHECDLLCLRNFGVTESSPVNEKLNLVINTRMWTPTVTVLLTQISSRFAAVFPSLHSALNAGVVVSIRTTND